MTSFGGFTFTNTSTPLTTSSGTGGFSFGLNTTGPSSTTTNPLLGGAASSGVTFSASRPAGLVSPQPAVPPAASGIGLGTVATTSSFSFSAAATTSTNTTSGGGFSFGSTSAGTPASSLGGLFSTSQSLVPASSTTASGLFLGGAVTTATTLPNASLGGFSLSGVSSSGKSATTTNSVGGFSFGQSQTSVTSTSTSGVGGFSFGIAATTTSTSTVSGLGGFSFATSTTLPTTNSTGGLGSLSFGFNPTSSSTATTSGASSFSFAGGSTASTSNSTSVGLGGGSLGLGGGPSFGLGGSQPPSNVSGDAANGIKTDGKPSKETPLPQDIFATIEAFENFKAEEKTASEANLRQSGTSFSKLGEDCQKLRLHVTRLATSHASLLQRVNALKDKIVKDGEDIEMARRTQSTPLHLQGDNSSPELYFNRTVKTFESQMHSCRERIEEVEKCLAVSGHTVDNEAALQELVRRQHEALQLAAARVYSLHAAMIRLSEHLPCPDKLRPRPLFRPGAGDLSALDDESSKSGVPSESSVVRSCFDLPGGASRLGTFQVNMAKARALSLNPAPPPTQPLQPQQLFGGGTFGTGLALGASNTGLFGNTNPTFAGSGLTSNTSNVGIFGTGNTSNTGFGTSNNFSFGNTNSSQSSSLFNSTFGQSNKLFILEEESSRKRRL